MEVVLPSAIDPAAASGDQHVLSALIAFAPVTEDAGALRDQLAKNVIAALSLYAPDLPSRVLMAQAQDPQSIAGASGRASTDWRGAPFGPMDPDNPYASPAPGLYFCGAGMHPRSGANGLAGRNCAEALLAGALRGAEGGS
jgi:phytoene dehydrogenase-like protein